MKKILLLFSFSLVLFSLSAQCDTCHISIEKKWYGYRFELQGQNVTIDRLLLLTQSEREAYAYAQKAKSLSRGGNLLCFVGSFCSAWTLGALTTGKRSVNWPMLGVGLGSFAIAFPLLKSANKNALRAAELYNSTGRRQATEVSLSIVPNGLSLQLAL